MKLDIVAPAGPSAVVMYAIGCFRRAALDITQSVSVLLAGTAFWREGSKLQCMASKITARLSKQT